MATRFLLIEQVWSGNDVVRSDELESYDSEIEAKEAARVHSRDASGDCSEDEELIVVVESPPHSGHRVCQFINGRSA